MLIIIGTPLPKWRNVSPDKVNTTEKEIQICLLPIKLQIPSVPNTRPGGLPVVLVVKNLPAMQETQEMLV